MDYRESTVSKLERLVTQYEHKLLRICYMYFGDKGLAEDAVQDTFLKAYKALPSFRGECSEISWLMRIAMNTCHDMKRNAWFRFVDRRVTPDAIPEPLSDPRYSEEDAVAQAISHLPVKYKEVILMYYYQGMTMKEISFALSIALPTVSKRLKQAYGKLKGLLGKEWNV